MLMTDLKIGQTGKILRIGEVGELKRRLMDMGATKGEHIKVERVAPMGDPYQIVVKGTSIAIRKSAAQNIEIRV
ncbi:MAG: FeoA family protein [Fusobacteriota bacterium]